jgi:large subunit ribosomal protein L12
MDLVYAALLLHSAKKEINEANLKKVVEAAGEKPEAGKIKALVSSLEGVDIEEAIKQTAVAATAAPAAPAAEEGASEEKKEEKKEEDQGKKAEEAAAGLSSLFG